MGKGKSTRLNKRLAPVAPGQTLIFGNVKPRLRIMKVSLTLLKHACYKLARHTKITRSDL
jgi:hypothetical protein